MLTVAELTPNDAALFRALRIEALTSDPDAFGQTVESAIAEPDSAWTERLAALGGPRGAVLVARLGEAPIGFCGVGPDAERADGAFLWGMFVRAERRGTGAASALLAAAEAWARLHGHGVMRGMVAAPNETAIEFYRRRGYQVGKEVGTLRPGSAIPVHPISRDLRQG
jgi:GNAT superfamily N-acetyltransferase